MSAIGLIAAIPVASIAIGWAFGAVWFDAPFGTGNWLAAILLATIFVLVLLFVRPFWRKLDIFGVLFAGVLIDTKPRLTSKVAAAGITRLIWPLPNVSRIFRLFSALTWKKLG